jgi:hypothetical protein
MYVCIYVGNNEIKVKFINEVDVMTPRQQSLSFNSEDLDIESIPLVVNRVDVMTPRRQYLENLPLAVRRPLSKSLSRILLKRKIKNPVVVQRGKSEGLLFKGQSNVEVGKSITNYSLLC